MVAHGLRCLIVANKPFFDGLPAGAYRVTIDDLSPGFTVKSITSGSTNLLNESLQIDRTRTIPPIQIRPQFSN